MKNQKKCLFYSRTEDKVRCTLDGSIRNSCIGCPHYRKRGLLEFFKLMFHSNI